MIKRKIDKQLLTDNVFLLGPRKVGKSTYLKANFKESIYIDLLNSDLYLEYTKNPGAFYENIMYQISNKPRLKEFPVIVDEIQKIPLLLNEVQRLIDDENITFILCGSSARKLVRGGANMLGGRASRLAMRGLAISEIDNFNLLQYINYGGIPEHYLTKNPEKRIKAYIHNYIQEEIKGEALVRNLQSFNKFLELVAITNAEEVNYSNIASDVGVDSKTITEYFQILIDTLLGNYLNPFEDKQKRSNILKSPKFYFFDTGIVSILKGIVVRKEIGDEFGKAFEHMVFNELVAYKNYTDQNFDISFWRTYENREVDFILG